uniref:Dynein axonemal heavy chain 8 n=1 Tax=Oncorhynchus kisutch TaxID=8019 RepID=A0A8C7IMJ7_ONCKI
MSGTSHPDSTGDPSPMADNVPTDRGAVGRRGSKFHRSGSCVQAVQETMKEKQARYKESREARKKLLTSGHKYIFEILADRLSLELQAVEEFVLDAPSLAPFDDFFAKGGSKTIAFVYQETEVPGIECGRTFPGTAKGAIIMRLFLANLSETCLTGLCPFFVRTKIDVPVNIKNIHEEIYFSMLDAAEGLLKGTRNLLSKIMMPAVCATENWGALNQSKHGEKDKQNFKDTITRYIHFLDACIEGTVQLKTASNIEFARLVSFEDVKAAAADVDMVHQLEEALMMWYKQIEQVLTESDQMRKEADASGPLTELEHWKRMSAKFNSIIEHIKGPECKAVVNVLNINRSKTLKLWRELDARITDCANEAKDNVKFLYTLEKVCQPLYNCDPVTMAKSIQNLINAIRMIHSVSQYYNTSERMTSLFIKVTNQMVTACRAYITDNGTSGIWEQDTQDIIKKIQVTDDGIKNMKSSQLNMLSEF